MSLIGSIWLGFNARHVSSNAMTGQKLFSHHYMEELSDTVTRDEFTVYDIVKTLSVLGTIISFLLICMGFKGVWASKSQSPKFTLCVFRKNTFRILAIFIIALCVHYQTKEMKSVIKHHQAKNGKLTKEHSKKEHHNRRHLEEMPPLPEWDPIQDIPSILKTDVTQKHHHVRRQQAISEFDGFL